jgi:hypothetical protein
MADPANPAPSPAPAAPEPAPGPAPKSPEVPEQPIPYSRFKETNDALKAAREENESLKKAQQDREEAAAKEQGKFQDLYNETKPKAERAERLEKVIQTSVDQLLQTIPEERRTLIPETLAPEDKLAYIHANMAHLVGPAKPTKVGGPSSPGTGGDEINDSTIFTADQLKDPEFYSKNKEAIRKASREGRIRE